MKLQNLAIVFFLVFITSSFPQQLNPDTVKSQKYDMGKMWTFENPPLDYFDSEYNFRPTNEWLEFVRKSALRFGNGCSASFISEDGLIITNHHCARNLIPTVQKNSEDFLRDGFFAKDLSEERKIEGLVVDQLIIIKDVTDDIHNEMNKASSDSGKMTARHYKIEQILDQAKTENNELLYRVIPLYNGGKFSLYGYKRYNDIRLVFAPDLRTAKFGGDYDNFTYPRYGLDCTFLRAYENNIPIKTKYFFKWSSSGAAPGEAVFVIGNPGGTDRISTIAQMEFARDIQYPGIVNRLRQLYAIQEHMVKENDAQDFKSIAQLYSTGNSLKVYDGTLKGLQDHYLMARKKDFEEKFRRVVNNNAVLKEKYSGIWDKISESRKEATMIAKELYAYNVINSRSGSRYFAIANEFVNYAEKISMMGKMPPTQAQYDSAITAMYPADLDAKYEKELLNIQTSTIYDNLDAENQIVQKVLGGNRFATEYMLKNSRLKSKEDFITFAKMTPEEILKSDDPFIYFIVNTKNRLSEVKKINDQLDENESLYNQQLGEALFAIYGDTIPPDATGTLRIADGVLQSYNYNGTIAPVYTTFYGVLDRYNSFGKKFPYNLPTIWENLPKEFDLNTKLDFITTNDIIGGNSGSPMINTKGEIVGLVFDGNIESLPANYIYTTEANRTIAVHSEGIIEGIRDLYKAYRVSDEILTGKMN